MEWKTTGVLLRTAGLFEWQRGREIDPAWGGRVSDNHVWVVIGGRGRVRIHSGLAELKRGVMVWMRPGWTYEASQDPRRPLRFFGVHFDLVDVLGRAVKVADEDFPAEHIDGVDLRLAVALLKEIVGEEPLNVARRVFEGSSGARAELYMATLLCEYEKVAVRLLPGGLTSGEATGEGPMDVELDRAAARLQAHPGHAPPIRELARDAGLSVSDFSHRFRRRFGLSPRALERRFRWLAADGMLKETDSSIKEIAAQLGFHDTSHFAHQFRKQFGMSPSQFRTWSRREAARLTGSRSTLRCSR
jgi:AraC-like DNA-binding protein